MTKQTVNRRDAESEAPEPNAESVLPRASAIVRMDPRESIPSRELAAPELPKPPATPRLSQWLRFGESGASPRRGASASTHAGLAAVLLLVGFGGGLLVAWLIGLI